MGGESSESPNFIDDVFPAELEEIVARRETLGRPSSKVKGGPSTDLELTGLALSGGGIRSAIFSLGVIQELARSGLLKSVDYLSTVSGGGYIGACLSSLLNQPENNIDDDFPLQYSQGAAEPPALAQLRNNGNYLTPSGLLNKLRLPNILLRGIVLNIFVFLPFIMMAVFLTEVAYEKGPSWNNLALLVFPLSLLFLVLTIIFPIAVSVTRRFFNWKKRNIFELFLTIPLLLVIAILVLVPMLNLVTFAIEIDTHQAMNIAQGITPASWWQMGLGLVVLATLFMLAGKASSSIARLSSKLLFLLIGLLGPAIIFCIYLIMSLWQIDSPYLPVDMANALNQATECENACLINQSQDDRRTLEDKVAVSNGSPHASLIRALDARALFLHEGAIVECKSGNCDQTFTAEQWRNDNREWVINDDPQAVPVCPPWKDISFFKDSEYDGSCYYFMRHSEENLRIVGSGLNVFDKSEDYILLGMIIFFLLFNRFFLDMNIASPHGFYRDRLSKAFLFKLDHEAEVKHDDRQKLSSLNKPGTDAPYHLINVALNLQASKDIDLRGRKSDMFILSKRFIGSERTSFVETDEMEKYDSHMDLATAIAISGAAAAPNMGTVTNRSLVFIMTLLNIRLGYWLPNPKRLNSKRWYHRLGLKGAKPGLIWREALGKINSKGSHINISDGGHIENLAIYPLLKRHCKLIVSVDGEADPDMRFGGLVTLMRFARIDMGIEIDINLDGLRKNELGNSGAHFAFGDINYGNGEKGQLLYIKLSVSGDEPEYVGAYRAENNKFPHESTADQFFTEEQFEAYRALGEYACKETLKGQSPIGEFSELLTVNNR